MRAAKGIHQGTGYAFCLGDWTLLYLCCHPTHLEKTVVNLKDRDI